MHELTEKLAFNLPADRTHADRIIRYDLTERAAKLDDFRDQKILTYETTREILGLTDPQKRIEPLGLVVLTNQADEHNVIMRMAKKIDELTEAVNKLQEVRDGKD